MPAHEPARRERERQSATAAQPIRPLSRASSASAMDADQPRLASWVTPEYETPAMRESSRKALSESRTGQPATGPSRSGTITTTPDADQRSGARRSITPELPPPENTERLSIELLPSPESLTSSETTHNRDSKEASNSSRGGDRGSLPETLNALVSPSTARRLGAEDTTRAPPRTKPATEPGVVIAKAVRSTAATTLTTDTTEHARLSAVARAPSTSQQQSRAELFGQIMRDLGVCTDGRSSSVRNSGPAAAAATTTTRAVTLIEILNLPPIRMVAGDRERAHVIARKLEFCTVVPSLPEWIAQTDYHQRVERWLSKRHALALDSLRTMMVAPGEWNPDAVETTEQASKRRPIGDERGTPGGMYVGLLGHNSARVGSIEQQPSPRLRTSCSAPALGQLADVDEVFESRSALRSVVERFTRLGTNGGQRPETTEDKWGHCTPNQGIGDSARRPAADARPEAATNGSVTVAPDTWKPSQPRPARVAALSTDSASPVDSTMEPAPSITGQDERLLLSLIQTPADLMDLKRAVLADLLDAAELARQHGSSAFTGHWVDETSTPSPKMPFVFQITASGTALERPVRDAGMSASSWGCRTQTSSSYFCYPQLPLWVQLFASNLFRPLPLRKRLAEPEYLSERETPTVHYVPERTNSSGREAGARPGSPGPTEGVAARGLAADMDHVVFVDDELTNPLDFLDPIWPHLELVYSLFIEFSLCRISQVPDGIHLGEELAHKYFTRRFLHSLLSLFVSEDPRERDALRTVVHRLYARYAPLRNTMRQVMAEVVFARPVSEDDTFRQVAWLSHCAHTVSTSPRTTPWTGTRESELARMVPATCANLPESAALAADNGLHTWSTDIFLAGSHPAALCSGLSYNGVSEALDILAAIVAGFSVPLKEEHRRYFRRVLLPMHKARGLARYHRELTMCVVFFVSKDISLGVEAIRALLRHWPRTSARKELLFLTEINDILTACGTVLNRHPDDSSRRGQLVGQRSRRTIALATGQGVSRSRQGTSTSANSLGALLAQFAVLVPEFFARLATCISSAQLDVSERAIYMVSNQELLGELVEKYRQQVYPILVPAVWRTTKEHWSLEVRHMASVLARLLQQLDMDRFTQFQPSDTTS
ncbi:hypothetical protein F1559_000479 [Cyanidiococcus yangmingshanensis]|uniref:Uncharacterized protein n=1 Tax=Cyanidiococcus yangmingshanensis TaxID=2690220 RepID=A0A7J7IF54_9RHOD|nr:hypothetical protein F1559_000479 [Cyanidiococcus yangmingshanensis]